MQLYLRISSVLLPLNIGPVICARPCECRHLGGRRVSVAALGVEMLTSSIRPRISGSSSAASTGSWSSSEKPPRNEGDPAAVTAWPLVERGASSRKRQVNGASDMDTRDGARTVMKRLHSDASAGFVTRLTVSQ